MTVETVLRQQPLRHGYTFDDLHRLSRHAVHQAGQFASDYLERYEIAWMAIAEYLYAVAGWPSYPELLRAGWKAIYDSVKANRHHYGYGYYEYGDAHRAGDGSRYQMYWWGLTQATPSCENRVIDKIGLHQILPQLTPACYDAVLALAVHGDYQAAAAALGINGKAFQARIIKARCEFRRLWHEGETPSRPWGIDRRAGLHAGQRAEPSGRKTIMRMRKRARARCQT